MPDKIDLVAYCGLYCGECIFHKGEVADMARDLRKKLRQVKFDNLAAGISLFFKEFKIIHSATQCWELWLNCAAAGPAGTAAPTRAVKSGFAARKRTLKAAGNAQILKPALNLIS